MHVERRLILRRAAQATLVAGVTAVVARASAAAGPDTAPARTWAQPADLHWVADQPAIVRRADWDTVAPTRPLPPPRYAQAVKAVFVHHTDSGNEYALSEVPSIIWSIHDDQTGRRGWDDIGYNFLVDRFGTIYEGRHGGVDRPVIGAHCSGFNINTAGIAAIGTFTDGATPTAAMLKAIGALVAWKLSLHGVDALSSTTLTCTDSESRYKVGSRANFAVLSGHTDADCTLCPGSTLYGALAGIRQDAARIQQSSVHPVFGKDSPVLQAKPTPGR
ncbi:peptidoglycan recognition protein family protein [Streptacidiphilus neutrinimicus]|uniref:peptidoglycan recognition protein family protein n=1 Tax=Streptacidiphilus neutrinimicus TaxID=105420 RepID=UPI0007C6A86A|nr:peptidoglycan recognition protein [Streptacidiphilus neutrinimicus]